MRTPLSNQHHLTILLLAVSLLWVKCSNIGVTRQDIQLEDDGGFTDLLIAIHDNVPEDHSIIQDIKREFKAASNFLLTATGGNLYFKQLSILVPQSWSRDASWKKPTGETLKKARVLIAPKNPAWGDTPYTLQPGLCGVEGDYIHLTSDYIKSKGPNIDKRLVREFAHLRWGVFDEDVPDQDTISPKFYIFNEKALPTKCTEGVLGILLDATSLTGGCTLDDDTGLPTDTCRFVPMKQTTSAASIMYAEYLSSVYKFCANGSTIEEEGDVTHNTLAPNRQNRICGQSIWSVLSKHSDFSVAYADIRSTRRLKPTFKILHPNGEDSDSISTTTPSLFSTTAASDLVVNTSFISGGSGQCQADLVCLTLDVSGSMGSNDRIGKMSAAVSSYILNHLPDGTIVALTEFESSAYELANMTNITDADVRDELVDVLPTFASGGTNIGAGMELCRQILVDYTGEDNSAGSRILVLSDGDGSIGSLDTLVEQGIIVDTIAYSQDASTSLSLISDTTGGLAYFTGDNDASVGLQDALISTIQRDCTTGITTLVNRQVTIASGESSLTQEIYIDSTLGDETKLTFSYTADIDVNVTTPDNNNYTVSKNDDLKLITIQIHGEVTGVVTYTITRSNPSSSESVTITITSKPVRGVEGINVDFRTESTDVSFTSTTLGLTPIQGLTVTAVVSRPQADDYNLRLSDNGLGPDSTPSDGIYTGMLSANEMAGDGYYSIRVLVSGEGTIPSDEEELSRRKRSLSTSIGEIQRVQSGGYFSVDNFFSTGDQIPPGKITDLRLTSAVESNNSFKLTWSAPGDDGHNSGMNGTFDASVLEYQICVSDQPDQCSDTVPTSAFSISHLNENISDVGSQVQATIDAGQLTSTGSRSYFFKVNAEDEAGNVGEWSNVVSATFVDPDQLLWPILIGTWNETGVFAETTLPTTTPTGTTVPTTIPTETTNTIGMSSTTRQTSTTTTILSQSTQSTEIYRDTTTGIVLSWLTTLPTEVARSRAGATAAALTVVWILALGGAVVGFYFIKKKFSKVNIKESPEKGFAAPSYFETTPEVPSRLPRHTAFYDPV